MIRSIIFTILLITLLQIQVGNKTLESHAVLFFKSSSVGEPLNMVVQGGIKLAKELYKKGKTALGLEKQ